MKSNGNVPNATSGFTSKQIDPGGEPAAKQSTLEADNWLFRPTRLTAPGPLAVPVTVEKSRPRSFRSKAARYMAVDQSPVGVPATSKVSESASVCVNVNVRPWKVEL